MGILLLALFGGLGTLARYGVSQGATSLFGAEYPWGTFIVNLLGSFLFGAVFGLFQQNILSPQWKLLLLTGFLGGFTTFSAFSHENAVLLEHGNYSGFAFHCAVQTLLGLAAVVAGLRLTGC